MTDSSDTANGAPDAAKIAEFGRVAVLEGSKVAVGVETLSSVELGDSCACEGKPAQPHCTESCA